MIIKPRSPEDMDTYNDLKAEEAEEAEERELEKKAEKAESSETVSDIADSLLKKILGGGI